jgi:hypothetical protein
MFCYWLRTTIWKGISQKKLKAQTVYNLERHLIGFEHHYENKTIQEYDNLIYKARKNRW